MTSWIEAIVCVDILSQDFLSESGNFFLFVCCNKLRYVTMEARSGNSKWSHKSLQNLLLAIDTVAAVFVNISQPVHRKQRDAHERQPLQNSGLTPDGRRKLILRRSQSISIWHVPYLLLQPLFHYLKSLDFYPHN
jgi:hypothetical protein